MAGAAITEYLAHEDSERFTSLIRRYTHDVISTAANLSIGGEVSLAMLTRRTADILPDPAVLVDVTPPFTALAEGAKAFPVSMRHFVWGENPDDRLAAATTILRRWRPFDAAKWQAFLVDYIPYADGLLTTLGANLREIEAWNRIAVLVDSKQSADLRGIIAQMRETFDATRALLDPVAAEQRVLHVITPGETEAE